MPAELRIYRRIAGRTATLAGYHRLYTGPDHLLLVRSTGVREDYRRFFFRDIQAILVRPTNRRRDNAIAWGAFTALTGLPAIATALAGVAVLPIVLGVLALVFGAFLAMNQIAGPTCECVVQTAVQSEPLPALNRLLLAEKFVAQLRDRVAEVQGTLAPEELAARLAAERFAGPSAEPELPPVIAPEAPPAA